MDPEGIARFGVPKQEGGRAGAAVHVGEATRPAEPSPATPSETTTPVPQAPTAVAPVRPMAGEYEAGPVTGGGSIRGKVVFTTRPSVPVVQVTKDKIPCKHEQHPSERILFDAEGLGVERALVYIRSIAAGKDWSGDMAQSERTSVIDQKGCVYIPHIMIVRTNTQIAVKNSDSAEHNIHAFRNSFLQNQFNLVSSSNSLNDSSDTAYLEDAAKYIVKCDIHPWMNAYIHAVEHPYYVLTGKDGSFELSDVPAGTWEVACWHEGMKLISQIDPVKGEISGYDYGMDIELPPQSVTVTKGQAAEVQFQLTPP